MSATKKIYLSKNFKDMNRYQRFEKYLNLQKFNFEQLNKHLWSESDSSWLMGEKKNAIREQMMDADCYLVLSDRYAQYHEWVELEIFCATFLDIPIVVIQPWSSWSIPQQLKLYTWKIFNWEDKRLIAFLESCPYRNYIAV